MTPWYIWKLRCNKVFRNENLDCWLLASKAIAHTREYFYTYASKPGRNLIFHTFTARDSPILIISDVWNREISCSRAGFYICDYNAKISIKATLVLKLILYLKQRLWH